MKDDFHYFRDHEVSEMWGVRNSHSGRVVARHMDKTDALMLAVFLDGDAAKAEQIRDEMRRYFPVEEITASA